MTSQESSSKQGLMADQFMYFFLRLRKERIRKVVNAVNASFPQESVEQKARRLVAAQVPLSFLGGTIMHLPTLIPGFGDAIRMIGIVSGTAVVSRMHLYLLLEIALLYGRDIDDAARVPEMLAIVAATGLAAGAPLLANILGINPLFALPAAGLTASAVATLIGETAIQYYSKAERELPAATQLVEIPA